jgi:flagellar protein FlaG
MNDITAVSGGQSAWPASSQPAGTTTGGGIRVSDNQSADMGEKGLPGEITRDDIEAGIDNINEAVSMLNRSIKFVVHEDTGKLMVQVMEKESGKLITEIPPHVLLDIEARIEKFIGILFDRKI